jgi:hypothetical protein
MSRSFRKSPVLTEQHWHPRRVSFYKRKANRKLRYFTGKPCNGCWWKRFVGGQYDICEYIFTFFPGERTSLYEDDPWKLWRK